MSFLENALTRPSGLTSLKSCLVRLAGNETKHGFNRVGFGASGLRAGSDRSACMVGPSTPTFNLKPPGGAITPLCTERNTRDLCPRPRSQRLSYLSTSNPRRLPCLGSLQFGLGARRRDLDAQAPNWGHRCSRSRALKELSGKIFSGDQGLSPKIYPLMILPQVHLRKPCYDFYFL